MGKYTIEGFFRHKGRMEMNMPTIKKEGSKVYLEGVRKVSWDTGEMCEFASALVSAMQCLGERVPYYYVMGTSGVALFSRAISQACGRGCT